MNRKSFIKNSIIGVSLLSISPLKAFTKQTKRPPQLDPKLVKEFVGAGHNNLERVKQMLSEYPNLIYCSIDQGNGDFEQAIEGAGHTGNKEIANYLISQGARPNLFVLSMLGKTDLIIPTLETYPKLIYSKGAHGFTLLHHAKIGKANHLCDYLIEKGLKKTFIKIR